MLYEGESSGTVNAWRNFSERSRQQEKLKVVFKKNCQIIEYKKIAFEI